MSDLDPSLRSSVSEVEKSGYLLSLGDENSLNINAVSNAFLDHLRQTGRRGALIAVGGTVNLVTRGTPRKDIDLLAVIENSHDFNDWLAEIEKISNKSGIVIGKINNPIPDHEYGLPINLHDGSVVLVPRGGVPIEIVRQERLDDWKKICDELRAKTRDFSILGFND